MDADRLKAIDVFAVMGAEARRKLSILAIETSVPAGHVLLREGDYAQELIAVEEGEAEVLRDGRQVGVIGPGECVGETALLYHSRRTATVVATTPMRLAIFGVTDLRRIGIAVDLELEALFEQRGTEVPTAN